MPNLVEISTPHIYANIISSIDEPNSSPSAKAVGKALAVG